MSEPDTFAVKLLGERCRVKRLSKVHWSEE
jgi:hypothetical protein